MIRDLVVFLLGITSFGAGLISGAILTRYSLKMAYKVRNDESFGEEHIEIEQEVLD